MLHMFQIHLARGQHILQGPQLHILYTWMNLIKTSVADPGSGTFMPDPGSHSVRTDLNDEKDSAIFQQMQNLQHSKNKKYFIVLLNCKLFYKELN